jgi:hypothetical protein
MVAENFAELGKASSLVVNGHHRVPPRPMTRSLSIASGDRATGLRPISSRVSASCSRLHGLRAMRWPPIRWSGTSRQTGKRFRWCHRVFSGSTFTDKPDLSNLLVEFSNNRLITGPKVSPREPNVNPKNTRAKKVIILED